jgi:mercuric ion transport protein
MKNKLLSIGIFGTVIAALCCLTPLLPITLTALGLTGLLGLVYNDAVLLPAMAFFALMTLYAVWP